MKRIGAIALGLGVIVAIVMYAMHLVKPVDLPNCDQRMWSLKLSDPDYDQKVAAIVKECHHNRRIR